MHFYWNYATETSEGRFETQERGNDVSVKETGGWSPETGAWHLCSWMQTEDHHGRESETRRCKYSYLIAS